MMIIKKIALFFLTTFFTTYCFATGDGFYFGIGVGEGNTNNKPRTVSFTTNTTGPLGETVTIQNFQNNVQPSNTGLAGRFFLGTNFNQYVAAEFGYTHYPNTTYNANNLQACVINPITNACPPPPEPGSSVPPTETSKSPEISENAVDLLVKGMVPLGPFGVFAKGGIAYVRQSAAGSLTEPSSSGKNNSINNFVGPELALGAYYDLTPNWEADFSVSRVFYDNTPADLYAISISYHFVTLYCGQFIC